jgi:hypothetical protein
MPNPVTIAAAVSIAAVASAALVFLCGWPWRAPRSAGIDAGWVLGVTAGTFAGCWITGIQPHWRPREDLDRLLLLVLPAVMSVELLAVFHQVPRSVIWPLRFAVVASTTPVLLYGSSYLSDVGGLGTSEWTPAQAVLVLGALTVALGTVWILLALLAHRSPGLSHAVTLAGTSTGAALAVMLSGYATGGQFGLPLAGALVGALAALCFVRSPRTTGPIGVAVVGLFSLLVIGLFFGQLAPVHAILLFSAPLLAWLPELPYLRRFPPWTRGLARVLLVGTLVAAVVVDAEMKFVEASKPPIDTQLKEPSIQDYMDFGR